MRRTHTLPMLGTGNLEVHSWGGLGSQLFALAFALEVINENQTRNIELVLHTSGVTLRRSEFEGFHHPRIKIRIVDDFVPPRNDEANFGDQVHHKLNGLLKDSLKFWLSATCLVVTVDPPDSRIRGWTKQVRSHYYKRSLNPKVISQILGLDFIQSLEFNKEVHAGAIHYRLGDLTTLVGKSPISLERMLPVVKEAQCTYPELTWNIASDSPGDAISFLTSAFKKVKFSTFEGNAWETLSLLTRSKVLIASPSKLSVWGIIFGLFLNFERTVFVPKGIMEDVKEITRLEGKTTFVTF